MQITADAMSAIQTSPEIAALSKFMFETYPARDRLFTTSWECSSLDATEEEMILDDVMIRLDLSDADYFELLPSLVLHVTSKHAKTDADREAAETFLSDAMSSLFRCHLEAMSNDNLTIETV